MSERSSSVSRSSLYPSSRSPSRPSSSSQSDEFVHAGRLERRRRSTREEREGEELIEEGDEREESRAKLGVGNRGAARLAGDERGSSESRSNPGYSSAMASDAIFQMFPEPRQHQEMSGSECEDDGFLRKQYPMLYMTLKAREHPSIADVRYANEGANCSLCRQLDNNTLGSIKVLKPHEVKGYLNSYNLQFTEEQVNVHLAHTAGDENVIGVIQNMSVDLISKSYSLANAASLRVMHRITTHMGRALFVPDLDAAKVHNDAVKQFMGLAATCQALMKHNHVGENKGVPAARSPLL